MINRWRLEKADPKAKLSPPKKQIIWYVEDTVPHEYRPYVEEGIREWNKAFEKIGFRDAIAVRWQEPGRDDFDPEDINYCTFRWITTEQTFAMSCLRANPLTGEMIDGDVIFDASWIRLWKQEYAFLTGTPVPTGRGRRPGAGPSPLAVGEIISPIHGRQAGLRPADARCPTAAAACSPSRPGRASRGPSWSPPGWSELDVQLRRRQAAGRFSACQLQRRDAARARPRRDRPGRRRRRDDDKDKDDKDKDKKDKDKKDEAEAPRGVPRPGDQGSRDARGRPLARPPAQLQGQHDADRRPAQRHGDHPGQGAERAA